MEETRRQQVRDTMGPTPLWSVITLVLVSWICTPILLPQSARPIPSPYKHQSGDSIIARLQQKLVECQQQGNERAAAIVLRQIGERWLTLSDFGRAAEAFERGLRAMDGLNDTAGMVRMNILLGRMHTRKGDFQQSMKFLQRSLQLSESLGDRKLLADVLWVVGIEHDFQAKYDDALEYLQRCAALRMELADRRNTALTLEIMGAVSTNKGDFRQAFTYLERCREIAESIEDEYLIALNLHGFGRNYRDMGALMIAVAWMKQALCAYAHIRDRGNMEFMARSIGDLYSREGRFDSAAVYLDSAMVLANETGQFIRIGAVHQVLSDHFARTGDFHEALEHFRLYRSVQDSMLNQRSVEQINELTVRYQTDRKDQLISALEKDKHIANLEMQRRGREFERRQMSMRQREQKLEMMSRQREIQDLTLARQRNKLSLNQSQVALNRAEITRKQRALALQSTILSREIILRNTSVTTLLLVVLLTVFIVLGLRRKRRLSVLRALSAEYVAQASAARAEAAQARAIGLKAETERKAKELHETFTRQLIDSQEQERKRIAGSLHDGIGQDLLIIKHRAMLAMEEGEGNSGHLRDILEISTEAIDDVRRISRDLRPFQLERLGLTVTLQSMLRAIGESTDLEITTEISDVEGMIAPEREIDLYRVVQEALNNILRHANARQVLVRLEQRNGMLLVTVRDDGMGFDASAARDGAGSGLGLQGMAERVCMLGGKLSIDSAPGEGTLIRVILPVAEHAKAGGDGP